MSTVRSNVRTKSTESEQKRHGLTGLRAHSGRVTRAEFSPSEPLLEYISPSGGHRKWCSLYYGGESRAGI
jgi:hypothetical protein